MLTKDARERFRLRNPIVLLKCDTVETKWTVRPSPPGARHWQELSGREGQSPGVTASLLDHRRASFAGGQGRAIAAQIPGAIESATEPQGAGAHGAPPARELPVAGQGAEVAGIGRSPATWSSPPVRRICCGPR